MSEFVDLREIVAEFQEVMLVNVDTKATTNAQDGWKVIGVISSQGDTKILMGRTKEDSDTFDRYESAMEGYERLEVELRAMQEQCQIVESLEVEIL